MPRLPRVGSKQVLRALLRVNFHIHHQTGSHANLRHFFKPHLHVVVPANRNDLSPKTLKSIIFQAELSLAEFIDLL